MIKEIIIKAYVDALEGIVGDLKIIERRISNKTATYHLKRDPTIERLIRVATEEIRHNEINSGDSLDINQSDNLDSRTRLYHSFYDGKGLDSPEEIKQGFYQLIREAKKTLPTYSNQKSESTA